MVCTISASAIQLVPTSVDHVIYVADHLREIDREELRVFGVTSMRACLMGSYLVSEPCWTLLCEDRAAAVGGVAQCPEEPETGSPWFLATDLIDLPEVRLALAYRSQRVVQQIQEKFAKLENWILANNGRTLAWLQWLGFEVSEAKEVPFASAPVRHITRHKEATCALPSL